MSLLDALTKPVDDQLLCLRACYRPSSARYRGYMNITNKRKNPRKLLLAKSPSQTTG